MTATINAEHTRQYKIRFSFIEEQMLAFASSLNIVRAVKHVSPNSKQIA